MSNGVKRNQKKGQSNKTNRPMKVREEYEGLVWRGEQVRKVKKLFASLIKEQTSRYVPLDDIGVAQVILNDSQQSHYVSMGFFEGISVPDGCKLSADLYIPFAFHRGAIYLPDLIGVLDDRQDSLFFRECLVPFVFESEGVIDYDTEWVVIEGMRV